MVVHDYGDVFDDEETRLMGEAYDYVCDVLQPNDGLRMQVVAAVLEAVSYGHTDKKNVAQAALELVYIDTIESDLLEQ